ncbi:MAG: PBSX family phage terminase large subunit [Eubacterium sp.]
MNNFFTPKQEELVCDFKHGKLKRINILEGSVRSGKTWISLILFAIWVATMPETESYLMVGKTMTALKRNCLEPLRDLVGENNFNYSFSSKEGMLFGRRVYLEGVNDTRAEGKIRGLTLAGAYGDEVSLFTEDFFTMLLSRLSVTGAKFIGTTNPDAPQHWLQVQYLKRSGELNLYCNQFLIDDNTTLDPKYVEAIKAEYTGVYYQRFILGKWVVAEGLVYAMFNPEKHVIDAFDESDESDPLLKQYFISIDYGTANPFAALLWRIDNEGRGILVKEYYYNSREKREQLSDEEYYRDLEKFATIEGEPLEVELLVIDPSAASFIELIRQRGRFVYRKGDNAVLEGIRYTSMLMNRGYILIDKRCTHTIDELRAYAWDGKSQEDKVIKEHDHAMDAMRYFVKTVLYKRMRGWW